MLAILRFLSISCSLRVQRMSCTTFLRQQHVSCSAFKLWYTVFNYSCCPSFWQFARHINLPNHPQFLVNIVYKNHKWKVMVAVYGNGVCSCVSTSWKRVWKFNVVTCPTGATSWWPSTRRWTSSCTVSSASSCETTSPTFYAAGAEGQPRRMMEWWSSVNLAWFLHGVNLEGEPGVAIARRTVESHRQTIGCRNAASTVF